MEVKGTNEKADSRSAKKGHENIYQPGGAGVIRNKGQATGSVSQRIYRTGSPQPGRDPRGASKVGGNIDQLIRTIHNQIAANQSAIEGLYDMQSQLKACLDELIEIREESKNVD